MSAALLVAGAQAESITHGSTTINMDFVNIGYAGNVADTTGYGAVDYNYRIGRYEVTADQWESVIAADPNVGNAGDWAGSQPTASSSWYEAAKFANWLTTGNAHSGAYQFDGSGVLTGVDRAAALSIYDTVYVLPSEDEWYKAAYFKSDGTAYTCYATGNTRPVADVESNYEPDEGSIWHVSAPWNVGTGIVENNGTYDMNGNVWEWNESATDGTLDDLDENRVWRGGSYGVYSSSLRSSYRSCPDPSCSYSTVGFRVAAIPEPSSVAMIGLVCGCGVFIRRRLLWQ